MVRSFLCNENTLVRILDAALNPQDPSTDTVQKVTTLDDILDKELRESQQAIAEPPPSSDEEKTAAFTKPKEDPFSLCLLLGKQSTDQLTSKIKSELKDLKKQQKKYDAYVKAKAHLEDLKKIASMSTTTSTTSKQSTVHEKLNNYLESSIDQLNNLKDQVDKDTEKLIEDIIKSKKTVENFEKNFDVGYVFDLICMIPEDELPENAKAF
jgi:histone acetyltransferase (RNA polymerase elongator complex component)